MDRENKMIVYSFHPDTFVYVGETEADESPLEKGNYLFPSNTTWIEPPEYGVNEIPRFNGDEWEVVADFRGTWYDEDGNEQIIEDCGVEPDPTWTETPPPPPTTYEKKQFTSLEYLDRFTMPEQQAIVTATDTDPEVRYFYDRLLAASFIDLEDPRTEQGLDLLISKSLLEASRKDELLEPEIVTINND